MTGKKLGEIGAVAVRVGQGATPGSDASSSCHEAVAGRFFPLSVTFTDLGNAPSMEVNSLMPLVMEVKALDII